MTLSLGQRGCVNSARRILPFQQAESKSFDAHRDVNSLTIAAVGQASLTDRGRRRRPSVPAGQSSWIVTLVIATGSSGRSFEFRGADTIASTTSMPFVTWPKSV